MPTPPVHPDASARVSEFMQKWSHRNAQTELGEIWPTFLVNIFDLYPLIIDASRVLLYCNETQPNGATAWEILTTYHPARQLFQVTLRGYQVKVT